MDSSDHKELYIALGKIFKERSNEPLTSNEVVEELRSVGIHASESTIRDKLDSLVGFGSLKQKTFNGEDQLVIYWTKKLFSIQESTDIMGLKKQLAESIRERPSKQQQETFDKEIMELKETIHNVENKLNEQEVPSGPHSLKILSLEREIQAIISETSKWKSNTAKAIEKIIEHFPNASQEQVMDMISSRK